MAADMGPSSPNWFGVRCVFSLGDSMYEERVTLWQARNLDHAIELAEAEASNYSKDPSDADQPIRYVKLAQAYQLVDQPQPGAEVFSLIRDSDLDPHDYLSRYFDTGDEHQQGV